jgi:hypothetical protein
VNSTPDPIVPDEIAPFRSIQYRPDLPNCNEVCAFLGNPEPGCHDDGPHPEETWWIDYNLEAECGDWIITYPSGLIEIVSDEFYWGPRP